LGPWDETDTIPTYGHKSAPSNRFERRSSILTSDETRTLSWILMLHNQEQDQEKCPTGISLSSTHENMAQQWVKSAKVLSQASISPCRKKHPLINYVQIQTYLYDKDGILFFCILTI
jgi:hypothetical protein